MPRFHKWAGQPNSKLPSLHRCSNSQTATAASYGCLSSCRRLRVCPLPLGKNTGPLMVSLKSVPAIFPVQTWWPPCQAIWPEKEVGIQLSLPNTAPPLQVALKELIASGGETCHLPALRLLLPALGLGAGPALAVSSYCCSGSALLLLIINININNNIVIYIPLFLVFGLLLWLELKVVHIDRLFLKPEGVF